MMDGFHRLDEAQAKADAVGGRVVRDRLYHVEVGAPAESDNKPAWVDYAVREGWDRQDAEDATKEDLINEFG